MRKDTSVTGRVHSIQTLGTLDGPGVRFVVCLHGCNLRCGCCHNPDTWETGCGTEYEALAIAEKAERYRAYFGKDGGITLSGGEPLLQAGFACEIFRLCKQRGINTCLDTSGSIWNGDVEELLRYTDRVLLDIKYPTDEQYRAYVGCNIAAPLHFLSELNRREIAVTLRQVVIPTLNDNLQSTEMLSALVKKYSCVDRVELLPFKKICQVKYDGMGIPFRFAHMDEPSDEAVACLQERIEIPERK